jgi:hypothetical protein
MSERKNHRDSLHLLFGCDSNSSSIRRDATSLDGTPSLDHFLGGKPAKFEGSWNGFFSSPGFAAVPPPEVKLNVEDWLLFGGVGSENDAGFDDDAFDPAPTVESELVLDGGGSALASLRSGRLDFFLALTGAFDASTRGFRAASTRARWDDGAFSSRISDVGDGIDRDLGGAGSSRLAC